MKQHGPIAGQLEVERQGAAPIAGVHAYTAPIAVIHRNAEIETLIERSSRIQIRGLQGIGEPAQRQLTLLPPARQGRRGPALAFLEQGTFSGDGIEVDPPPCLLYTSPSPRD